MMVGGRHTASEDAQKKERKKERKKEEEEIQGEGKRMEIRETVTVAKLVYSSRCVMTCRGREGRRMEIETREGEGERSRLREREREREKTNTRWCAMASSVVFLLL